MLMHALAGAVALACCAIAPLGAQRAESTGARPQPPPASRPLVLTRDEAVAQALAHNPQLEAARQQVSQARARATQATAFPDPEVGASMEDQTRILRPGDAGSKVTFNDVILGSDGDKTFVGVPTLKGAPVAGEIVKHGRDKKIVVFKMKRRKNYAKKQGHRQGFTEVRIGDITLG